MPYRNRGLSLRPVHSEKHEITWSFLAQNASAVQSIVLVKGVTTLPTGATEVAVGSTVKSLYFETNLNGVDNSAAAQVFHWAVFKRPSGSNINTDPAQYNTPEKRWIFHRGMEMLPDIPIDSGGTVQTKRIFVVKLPPKFRRIGEGDEIKLNYKSSSTSGINFCGIVIYKHFE